MAARQERGQREPPESPIHATNLASLGGPTDVGSVDGGWIRRHLQALVSPPFGPDQAGLGQRPFAELLPHAVRDARRPGRPALDWVSKQLGLALSRLGETADSDSEQADAAPSQWYAQQHLPAGPE